MPEPARFVLYSSESLDPVHHARVASEQWPGRFPQPWRMELRRLEGGRRDGVHLLQVDNGRLRFDVLPTRGMGLWRGSLGPLRLGWDAPLAGPVHPAWVNLHDRGGLGWLDGFDEWLVRCGLSSLGPPGTDPATGEFLPLHGRIANQPAHHLELQVELEPPFALRIIGWVREATQFFQLWDLKTTYTTWPGSGRLQVEDEIINRRSTPAELFLLYHLNFGPPLLAEGSRLRLPLESIEPRDDRAKPGLETWDTYPAPTPGFAEQVFYTRLKADAEGKTWALLHDQTRTMGCRLSWSLAELPYFTQWKNCVPLAEGYVTGLEPGTCYPNPRAAERQAGRAVMVPAGGTFRCGFNLEFFGQGVPTGDFLA